MRDIGLIPLVGLLVHWPDATYGLHLVQGFPTVGHCLLSEVFAWREVPLAARKDIFQGSEENNRAIVTAMRPGKDDGVILSTSIEDFEKGFASRP